jgi:hypothetical protein
VLQIVADTHEWRMVVGCNEWVIAGSLLHLTEPYSCASQPGLLGHVAIN